VSVRKRQLKHGFVWQVQWYEGSRQRSRHFKLKADAIAWDSLMRENKRRGNGYLEPPANPLFEEFVTRFLSTRESLGIDEKTHRRQVGIVKNHFLPHIGHLKIAQVRHTTVNGLVADWLRQELAPRTIHQHLQFLSQVFNEAIYQDMLTKNPVDGVRRPRANPVKKRVLTETEAQRLLEACDETEKPFLHFALATGMRFNELAALEWCDVDFNKKNLYVRKSKTAAGIRDISINNSDIEVLREIRRQTTEKHGTSDLVFRSGGGHGVDYDNFTKRRFLPLVKRIGLTEVRFNDLRRTHATMLVLAGLDPMTITQRMGHSHISTTLQYYAAADEIRRREAANVSTKYTTLRRSLRNSTPVARLSPALGLRGVDGSLRRQRVPTR